MESSSRDDLIAWQQELTKNFYLADSDLVDIIRYYFVDDFPNTHIEFSEFAEKVATQLEPLVAQNNLSTNLPHLNPYNAIGERVDTVVHHPDYLKAGDIIYGSKLLSYLVAPKTNLLKCLSLFFISSQTGEAGHHCPIACSAGIIRILKNNPDLPNKQFYLEKLTSPSYQTNYTGAQFLTEIQGGSDVGLNKTAANFDGNDWRIKGEKWFCSNANADLILMTARYQENSVGTKGLGLFLVPRVWGDKNNYFRINRLKDKLGTRTMATAEIEFQSAIAYPVGQLENAFHLVMENVLHISRLFNSFCVLSMARRAYWIAFYYAKHRIAFSKPILEYPLILENLCRIKSENTAMMCGIFATAYLQDKIDNSKQASNQEKLLLRLLVNIQKYLSAKWSVEHIHHALDVLAGNGTIETFSAIPRLLRDCIVCENWEGTHNTLRMQILKDILKYNIDQIYLSYMRNELSHITQDSAYIERLSNQLDLLQQEVAIFRSLTHSLQTLQIKKIVDRMAILFCSLHLLLAGEHQQKNRKNSSKMDCLEFFWERHIEGFPIRYDEKYLQLITRINCYPPSQ